MSEGELEPGEVIREVKMEIPTFQRKDAHERAKLTTRLGKPHGVISGATGGISSRLNPVEDSMDIKDYKKVESPAEASGHETNQN